jgi:hypothetical protein
MSKWKAYLQADPIPWLLEKDNPSIRYYTLTELLGMPHDDAEVLVARREIMQLGDVPKLMDGQTEGGYWGPIDGFYQPRYKWTAWRFMLLADFGADGALPEIHKAASYLFEHSQLETGGFDSRDKTKREPGTRGIPCLTGNLVRSCIHLGYLEEPQVQRGIDWITKYIRFDDGDADHWPEWLPQDPNDGCWGRHTCFRGVIPLLEALAEIPEAQRTAQARDTLKAGGEYLLIHHVYKHSHDLSKPITQYTQLGYPLFAENDLLRMLLLLTGLGIHDPRMQDAVDRLVKKQNKLGQWKRQHEFPKTRASGFMPIPVEPKGQPSKWVTLRALTALKRYYS